MVNSSPALIACFAWRARVLLGNTEWEQLGTQEWDMKLKVGNIACPPETHSLNTICQRNYLLLPPLEQAKALVQSSPTALLMSSSSKLGSAAFRNLLT